MEFGIDKKELTPTLDSTYHIFIYALLAFSPPPPKKKIV